MSDRAFTDEELRYLDQRYQRLLAQQMPGWAKARVHAVDRSAQTASLLIGGASSPSPGYLYGMDVPAEGDVVLVRRGPPTGHRVIEHILGRPRQTQFNLRDYAGALGDGGKAQRQLQQAIDDASSAGGGDVIIPSGYEFDFDLVTITYPNVNIVGGGTLLNGTIRIGRSTGAYVDYNCFIEGIRVTRHADTNDQNFLELQRAGHVTVQDLHIGRYNAAIHVIPNDLGGNNTGHVYRLKVANVNGHRATVTEFCNFLVQSPRNISGGLHSIRELNVMGCTSFPVYDTHLYLEGVDGLLCVGNTFQAPSYTNTANNQKKRWNIYVDVGGFINIVGNQLFEAGLEAIHLNQVQWFRISDNNIAWPSQRMYRSAIKVLGGSLAGNEFVRGVIADNVIDNPKGSGVELVGLSAAVKTGHVNVSGCMVGNPGVLANQPWAASTAYTLGNIRVPTVRNRFIYRVTVAGTSAASQPTWPTTVGATVTDGTMTWINDGEDTDYVTSGFPFGSSEPAVKSDGSRYHSVYADANTTYITLDGNSGSGNNGGALLEGTASAILSHSQGSARYLSGGEVRNAGDPNQKIIFGTADPTAGAGVTAGFGSLYVRNTGATTTVYRKTGAAATAWTTP